MRSDLDTATDIVLACRRIQLFIAGMSEEEFRQDEKTQSAVQHQLLIIGEAAKRISESFRTQYPQVPWSPMARMRDKLIHAYDIINQDEVWRTATRDIPSVHTHLEMIINSP